MLLRLHWVLAGARGASDLLVVRGVFSVAHKLLIAACGIQFPHQQSASGPLHWELGALARDTRESLFLLLVLSIFASFIQLSVVRNINVYNVTAKRYIELVLKYNVLLCLL